MLRTNRDCVVKWSVQGKVHHPTGGGYRITHEGIPMVLPATGGISYNVHIGILLLDGPVIMLSLVSLSEMKIKMKMLH